MICLEKSPGSLVPTLASNGSQRPLGEGTTQVVVMHQGKHVLAQVMVNLPHPFSRRAYPRGIQERQNKARTNPSQYTPQDLARMREGKPPIGTDGHPKELHHTDRTMGGSLQERTRTDHRLGENFRKNHPD
jgi:hypothetical protein